MVTLKFLCSIEFSNITIYLDIQKVTDLPNVDNTFQFPRRIGGRFERAMSSISINSEAAASGNGTGINYTDNNFREEVSQALAIKLNLKTHQHANEKILRNIVTTGGRCGTLKQVVQARSAVYDESVYPTWFTKGTDISKMSKTLQDRRLIRSQLIGAPLLVAQTDQGGH